MVKVLEHYLKKLLNQKKIDENTYNRIRPVDYRPGVLYGLPKVHNNEVSIRPTISSINTFNNNLAKFLDNTICERKQRVDIGEQTTEWMNVEASFIQGSVFDPVLFLFFIANADIYLPPEAETEKYVDDIISYIISTNATTELLQKIATNFKKMQNHALQG